MKKLNINGYVFYGDFELVIVEPPQLIEEEMCTSKYINNSVHEKIIELRVSKGRFNKGTQKKKRLNGNEFIDVKFTDCNGHTYEGLFVIGQINEKPFKKGFLSLVAQASGQVTLTVGDK